MLKFMSEPTITLISSEVAVFIAAYMPSEDKTIERTIDYLLVNVQGITRSNLYLVWNTREPEAVSSIKYSKLLNNLSYKCNLLQVKGSTSKSENLNAGIDILPSNFKYLAIYDADARPDSLSLIKLYQSISDKPKHAYIQGHFSFTRGNNSLVRYYDQMENILSNQIFTSQKKNYFKGHDAIFRIKALLDVDGFDPKALTEDSDISKRILALGYHGGYLHDHQSFSESPPNIKTLFQQRLRWCSGSYSVMPLGIIARFIGCIIWLLCYFFFPLYTLIISFIIGLLIMKFDVKLTLMFMIYPIIIILMTLNFFFNGAPSSFKPTARDINIAGKSKRRLERKM